MKADGMRSSLLLMAFLSSLALFSQQADISKNVTTDPADQPKPDTSHGLRDLVLGWHMSAAETGLSYFRFDGSSYHLVATAVRVYGEDGAKIVPNR